MILLTTPYRVRFLLGGRHGDFKFLPPAGYSPCYEALLPKEKMHIEAVKDYKRDHEGVRDLLGTTQFLSQSSFIPTPVDTSQVRADVASKMLSTGQGELRVCSVFVPAGCPSYSP